MSMFSTSREIEFVTADVFTETPFGGNQLAIIPDGRYLTDQQMQDIAREFNFSETIFILPPAHEQLSADIRIFTPSSELPFAGHPLVGAGWFLANQRRELHGIDRFRINVKAGEVAIDVLRNPQGVVTGAQLTSPKPLSHRPFATRAEMAACLSLSSGDVLDDNHPPMIAGCGTDFMFVQLASADVLARARPNIAAFEDYLPRDKAVGIYAYTTDTHADHEIEARMFAPLEGLMEDPATGSATVGFIGLYGLYHRPDRQIGSVRQSIRQGFTMGRSSFLLAEAEKYQGAVVATRVGGSVIGMTKGLMYLPKQEVPS